MKTKNKFKHSWNLTQGKIYQGKLSHKTCPKCGCEKYFDLSLDQTVYMDRFGHLLYRAPDCTS